MSERDLALAEQLRGAIDVLPLRESLDLAAALHQAGFHALCTEADPVKALTEELVYKLGVQPGSAKRLAKALKPSIAASFEDAGKPETPPPRRGKRWADEPTDEPLLTLHRKGWNHRD